MSKKIMLLLACLFVMVGLANAQSRITGTVISEDDGQPVIGASVIVKGTTVGTVTDSDGKFTLTGVPSSAKMVVVSYVGMQSKEVAIKSVLRITLSSDNSLLDEVLVVAYGTATKSSFTGSAAVVGKETIEKVQTSNVVDALNGKVSGVQMSTSSNQPGKSDPAIRIRGISSINAGNAPLIILDGTPYDGDLNTINNSDIESMTVLKDAASNALYGARGANGVIMITTKSGKNAQGAKINFDAKYGINTRGSILQNTINNPAQYYETYYQYLNNYALSNGMSAAQANQWANNNMIDGSYGLGYNVFTVPDGQYLIGTNGKMNPNATLGRYTSDGYYLSPDDWMDEAYKTGSRQEYNVNVSTAKEGANLYVSFGYLNNDGIIHNSNYERFSGRLKGDIQAKKWLKLGLNMSYSHYNSNFMGGEDGATNDSGNIFAVSSQMAPVYPVYIRDSKGLIMKDEVGNTRYDFGDGENAGLTRPFYTNSNPLSDAYLDTNNMKGNAFTGTGYFELQFGDFKFTSTNNVNLDEARSNYVSSPYWGYMSTSGGAVYKYHTRDFSYSLQQLLNWGHKYGQHDIQVMLGHESYKKTYEYLYGSKTNMSDPANKELIGAIVTNSTDSYTTTYMTEGWFGRAQYNFDEKYYVSASYRRDASSRFHPDNQWGNFWSAGGAWLINKEKFFHAKWVDLLKLKASFGQQGNDAIGNYRYTNTYNLANSSGHTAATPYRMGNKDITWEKGNNFNMGVEFEMFKQRLTGSVEYFARKTTNMLFSFPLPTSFGFSSQYRNVGDMTNKGFEIELKGDIIRTRDFTWSANFNLTHYRNKITYLADENKTATLGDAKGYTSGSYFYGEGLPIYTFRMKQYAGVDKETGEALYWKDTDNGREATANYEGASYYNCGTALPDAYGGFGTTISYKGFDLSADFAYQLGGQVWDYDYQMFMTTPTTDNTGYRLHADLLNAWTPTNTNTDIPRLQFGDEYTAYTSDRFLTSASYLSLQNITLGYTFPKSMIRHIGIENLRVYLTCDNVWYWSKRQGLDPRQSISGSPDGASLYSPIRSYTGGISLTF